MSLSAQVRIRFFLDDDIALGPGKASLLAAIRSTGSISAAAKQLGMSYRRAWLLVETMNACFEQPLVAATKGGAGGGGAMITPRGVEVLELFLSLQREADRLASSHTKRLRRYLRPSSSETKSPT